MDTAEKKNYTGYMHKSVNPILVHILRTVELTSYGHSIFKKSANLQLTVYINTHTYIYIYIYIYMYS